MFGISNLLNEIRELKAEVFNLKNDIRRLRWVVENPEPCSVGDEIKVLLNGKVTKVIVTNIGHHTIVNPSGYEFYSYTINYYDKKTKEKGHVKPEDIVK